jgi:hypothetical protein
MEPMPVSFTASLIARARELQVRLPAELSDPGAQLTPGVIVRFLRGVAGHFFPLLAGEESDLDRGVQGDPH